VEIDSFGKKSEDGNDDILLNMNRNIYIVQNLERRLAYLDQKYILPFLRPIDFQHLEKARYALRLSVTLLL
jgi:hypothetical protein